MNYNRHRILVVLDNIKDFLELGILSILLGDQSGLDGIATNHP